MMIEDMHSREMAEMLEKERKKYEAKMALHTFALSPYVPALDDVDG